MSLRCCNYCYRCRTVSSRILIRYTYSGYNLMMYAEIDLSRVVHVCMYYADTQTIVRNAYIGIELVQCLVYMRSFLWYIHNEQAVVSRPFKYNTIHAYVFANYAMKTFRFSLTLHICARKTKSNTAPTIIL